MSRSIISKKMQKGVSIMEDLCNEELAAEEINVYTDTCGEIQFPCLDDCLGGGAWLSIEH